MTKAKASQKFDIYQMVTDRVIAQLENGVVPWRKPWVVSAGTGSVDSRRCAVSHATGKPYSMLNQMLLMQPGEYATYKQVQAAGGHVKKGAKSSVIVFWTKMTVKDEEHKDADGKPGIKTIPVLRYYNVFHLSDCEGLEPKYEGTDPIPEAGETVVPETCTFAEDVAQAYMDGQGIVLSHLTEGASYVPALDTVYVPEMTAFENENHYYSTLFHELTHSTGTASRLARDMSGKFGSKAYAREELVAEMGSVALCDFCGVESEDTFSNSASYLQNWIGALKQDNRAIVTASGRAQKALELIVSYSVETDTCDTVEAA